MKRIHEELWELENQGQLDDSTVFKYLLSSLRCANKAKWLAVEHLRVK
jgi:hypothetical protein